MSESPSDVKQVIFEPLFVVEPLIQSVERRIFVVSFCSIVDSFI